MSFNNKVVLISDASSGVGTALAVKFAKEGAQVAIVGKDEQKLKDISIKCEKTGKKPLAIVADVSKDDDAVRIINETLKHFKQIDVLINNPGLSVNTSIMAENAMEVFDQVMNTNLRAVVCLTSLAGKHLVDTKGNIINISSITGLCVFTSTDFSYGTSRAALNHLTRTVASELASKGVRVNSISPGPIKIVDEATIPKKFDFMTNFLPLQRMAEPDEIADLALHLASDKAAAITGSSFVIDSGCLVKPKLNFAELAKK